MDTCIENRTTELRETKRGISGSTIKIIAILSMLIDHTGAAIIGRMLLNNGFDATYCLTMVKDSKFYSGKRMDGIYAFFRGNAILCGEVKKPTGNSEEIIEVSRKHSINWEGNKNQLKYYIVDVNTSV